MIDPRENFHAWVHALRYGLAPEQERAWLLARGRRVTRDLASHGVELGQPTEHELLDLGRADLQDEAARVLAQLRARNQAIAEELAQHPARIPEQNADSQTSQTAPEPNVPQTPKIHEHSTPPEHGQGQPVSPGAAVVPGPDRNKEKDPIREMIEFEPSDEDWS
jgi:hypothetical protein